MWEKLKFPQVVHTTQWNKKALLSQKVGEVSLPGLNDVWDERYDQTSEEKSDWYLSYE